MSKKSRGNQLLRNLLIVLVILVVLVAFARYAGWFGKKEIAQVYTATAQKARITEKVTASGKVQPESEVSISPDLSGEVVDVFVQDGDSVVQGQLLFRIRPDNIQALVESSSATVNARQANLAQAKADLSQQKAQLLQSEIDYKRNKELYDKKVISEADYQTAYTNYLVAQERVRSAEQNVQASLFNLKNAQANLRQNLDNLSRTEIYAPVSGTVSLLNVEKGESVVGTGQMSGTEMLRIADLTNMEVQVDVNENDIIKVKRGQSVLIIVDSYSATGRQFEGVVTEIANTANASASTDAVTEFGVKVKILNKSYDDLVDRKNGRFPFRPGMTASVDIITQNKEGVLSVPIAAVTTRSQIFSEQDKAKSPSRKASSSQTVASTANPKEAKEIVFLYNQESRTVQMQEVKTGINDFENIEIIKGLKEGDQIVSGPYLLVSKQLEDGQVVQKVTKDQLRNRKGARR